MRFIESYIAGTKKSFKRMPRMTIISVLSDFGLVASLGHMLYSMKFDERDFIVLGTSMMGFFLTRNYLWELNRFDDHMRKFVRGKKLGEDYSDNSEFMKEARNYADNHNIHDFELYLKRNFRG